MQDYLLAEVRCQRRRGTRAIPKWDWSGGGTFRIGTGGEESVDTKMVSEETKRHTKLAQLPDLHAITETFHRVRLTSRSSRNHVFRWPFACLAEGMRPLSPFERKRFRTASILLLVLPTTGAWTIGCGGGGAVPSVPPPPPPPSITVTISPKSGSVMLGNAMPFSAKVANT